jgi:CDP-4-dehydro-6-deoxyglucose reductase, E1
MMTNLAWPLMHNNITRSDLNVLIEYLQQENPRLTHGPLVRKFEEQWSNWLGVKHSVMLNSGASANDLTMIALRELRGAGEVIVPPLTWVSDISSVIRAGLDPVFVDIDKKSLALDANLILKSITPKTRAVFLTHILGYDGLTDELLETLEAKGIPLIEDVCESHGATHNGRKAGSFGWISNFSFYYAHHMTTIEGGMVSTNDSEVYDLLRILRSHGMVRESLNSTTRNRYLAEYPDLNPDFIFGYASHNMRSTELNALIGLEQLKRLDDNNLKRSINLNRFLKALNPDVFLTEFKLEGSSNYAFTLVLREADLNKRDAVERLLAQNGVEFRRGLSGGGNQLRQPYLRKLPNFPAPENFPVTDHMHHFGWYIGNYPELEHEKIDKLHFLLGQI